MSIKRKAGIYIMKILVISPKNRTVYNFRGELISSIISLGHEVIVTGPNKTDEEKIRALGAEFVDIPLDKDSVNPIKDIKYARALKKLIKEKKPDVVFSYTVKPIIYGSYAARKCGVKNIFPMLTGIGYVFNSDSVKAKLLRKPVSFLYKKTLKNANKVIFQNPDDLNHFVSKKLVNPESCVLVNGSGVNMSKFVKSPPPPSIVFFMLARLMKSKGVDEYLRAAEIVKGKYPDVNFWLLGNEGTTDTIPIKKIEPYVNNGTITHFPECENIVSYFQNCSVFVLPSYGEGTPRCVLEAMSCGKAIITTNAPGCRETVVDGVNGFLVPVKNAEAIAEKMVEFIKNPHLIETMGNASFEYCKEKFEVNKVNEVMLQILGLK